jgi:hypothetical protein
MVILLRLSVGSTRCPPRPLHPICTSEQLRLHRSQPDQPVNATIFFRLSPGSSPGFHPDLPPALTRIFPRLSPGSSPGFHPDRSPALTRIFPGSFPALTRIVPRLSPDLSQAPTPLFPDLHHDHSSASAPGARPTPRDHSPATTMVVRRLSPRRFVGRHHGRSPQPPRWFAGRHHGRSPAATTVVHRPPPRSFTGRYHGRSPVATQRRLRLLRENPRGNGTGSRPTPRRKPCGKPPVNRRSRTVNLLGTAQQPNRRPSCASPKARAEGRRSITGEISTAISHVTSRPVDPDATVAGQLSALTVRDGVERWHSSTSKRRRHAAAI